MLCVLVSGVRRILQVVDHKSLKLVEDLVLLRVVLNLRAGVLFVCYKVCAAIDRRPELFTTQRLGKT